MTKNIIFDIGGIIFDDSLKNISNILNEDASLLYNKVYGKSFKQCLLGNLTVTDYIETFKNDKDYNKIKFLLSKENMPISYPLIRNNYNYISKLKERGYNLYLLSNITSDTYQYINKIINIDEIFNGSIFSFKENIIKPDLKIFDLIIKRFSLNKSETIFFDDKQKNIDAALKLGIKGILFKKIDDIENNLY